MASAVPPEEAAYHCMPVPVAVKPATVPLLQNDCDAVPVGTDGLAVVDTSAVLLFDEIQDVVAFVPFT